MIRLDGPNDALCSTAAEGISSLAKRAARLGIALHSVLVSAGGEVVVSAACPPLGPDVPQRMYSVGKTLTGIAVGMLDAEGKLGLDDPVAGHFAELAPFHPWVEATTIRHLLAMRGPHAATTCRRTEGGWLESYFRVPPTHPPGTLFTYDTSGSYVLSALVERLGGGSLTDYLRPRLLDPLGVSPEFRILPGPEGVEHGGSGLICTARDLLRIAEGLLAVDTTVGGVPDIGDGGWGGRELPRSALGRDPTAAGSIPAGYWREATRPQADTAQLTWGGTLRQGYGYHVWTTERGGWLMFGMGGQIVYGDPSRDLAVVVTADAQACTGGDQRLLDDVMDLLVAPLAAEAEAGVLPAPDRAGRRTDVVLDWPAPRPVRATAAPAEIAGLPADASLAADADSAADAGLPAGDAVGPSLRASGPAPAELLSAARPILAPLGWDDAALASPSGEPVEAAVAGRAAVVVGHLDADTFDLHAFLRGDELTPWRVRVARAADGTFAIQSQAFGEGADRAWTFHTTYPA